jgi:signal recognition particle receptor subunit beta
MVLFNYSTRELTAKIVYYGPGLCGKTTNLQYIHGNLPETVKGKMLSLSTKTDRTLFFDFLPIDLGEIRGMKTRVQLYTVPGQVFYNETRKLVLKGADGIVFVADSQAQMLGANVESFKNLEENLKAHGHKLSEMPHVLQFNKRDLPKISGIEEINQAINRYNAPFYESVATTGIGVQDTLKAITKLVLLHLTKKYDPKSVAAEVAQSAPAAKPEVPAAPPVPVIDTPPAVEPAPVAAVAQPDSGSIPLSDVAIPGAQQAAPATATVEAPPPIVAEPEQESLPAFGDDEIDDLVDEVEENVAAAAGAVEETADDALQEILEQSVAEAAAETAAEAVEEQDQAVFEIDADALAIEDELPQAEVAEAAPVVAEQPVAESEAAPEAEDQPQFEVEHKTEPEWPDQQEAADDEAEQPAVDYEAVLEALRRGADSETESVPEQAEASAEEETPEVTLTEVVKDTELFEDPSLDIARMAAGQEREILIPVELKDGETEPRRFKLSIRLRLDQVD